MKSVKRNGRYGIDAPYVPALMITGALICIGLIVFAHMFQLWITVVILLVLAGVYLHTTRRGKFQVWRTLLASAAMATTEQNALAEGVTERVELHTADMRQLPFESGSFDLIVSSVAIHNISNELGRDQAIDEAWRVLRPGGRLLIADISKSRRYRQRLLELGAVVVRRNLGWRMWWGGPWVPTMLVDARKPA